MWCSGRSIDNHATNLVYCNSVDVGVINEPDDLVWEKFAVVLWRQVRFCRLRAVQLQSLADTLSQHVQSRVCLHYLCHWLLDQRLTSRKPVAKCTVQHQQHNVTAAFSNNRNQMTYHTSLQHTITSTQATQVKAVLTEALPLWVRLCGTVCHHIHKWTSTTDSLCNR